MSKKYLTKKKILTLQVYDGQPKSQTLDQGQGRDVSTGEKVVDKIRITAWE